MTAGRPSPAVAAACGVGALALDQATKSWAVAELQGRPPIHVAWTLHLDLSFNDGVAFSLGRGSGLAIVPIALVVVGVVVWSSRSLAGRLAGAAVGLVVGGALGNVADRLLRDHGGAVVDFIDLRWWPVFNVADVAVVGGGALLALCSFRRPADARPPAEGRAAT